MLVASQDFRWHDRGEGGVYVFGEDGYLTIDGSRGRARCSRRIENPIRRTEDGVALKLRVALGKCYHICFHGADSRIAIDCRIEVDGRIQLIGERGTVESGESLTFHYGKPYAHPAVRPPYVVPSDEHRLTFSEFDFETGTFMFTLDNNNPVEISGCIGPDIDEIRTIELASETVEPGSLIRLKEYTEYSGDSSVYRETFPLHWAPVPPPPDGMPDDNVCETLMRPVDYRWLETATKYGYVKVRIPPLRAGALEFEMKPSDAELESCLILEEYQGIIKYGNIQFGLLRGKIIICTAEGITEFDQTVEAANDRVYTFRVEWDMRSGAARLLIDGEPMTHGGSDAFSFANFPDRGIDTITLHPGNVRARRSLMQKRQGVREQDVPTSIVHWGAFRVYDLAGKQADSH
ncbi:MAG: hypothetical protein OXH06_05645 [Gemmatimonadetes bacterium]|nr:hypothetical protein [Gemmatimonadota bacterium]